MYFSVGKCARAPARFPTPTPILFFSGNGESRGYSSENSVSKPQPSRTQPTGLCFSCAVQLLTPYSNL